MCVRLLTRAVQCCQRLALNRDRQGADAEIRNPALAADERRSTRINHNWLICVYQRLSAAQNRISGASQSPGPRRAIRWAALALAAGSFLTLHAALTPWAENVVSGSSLEAAFFRLMHLPAGDVLGRRPPVESRDALSGLAAKSPQQADLYALRAQEEERLLDPAAAEADWKKAADLASDKSAAFVDLAHFYHRRVQPQPEFDALVKAGGQPSPARERFTRPENTISFSAFSEARRLVADARLGREAETRLYTEWMNRWPRESGVAANYFEALISGKRAQEAQALLDKYGQQHPDDEVFRVVGRAELAGLTQGPEQELAVYDKEFTPLWPERLSSRYYQLLSDGHLLRAFLGKARAQAVAQPVSIDPALRIYFYYDQQKKPEPAEVALLEFATRHDAAHAPWTATDLRTLGMLFEHVRDYDEAARAWYSLYSLDTAGEARPFGLAKLAQLLLLVPEQRLRLGNRDLSLYANIGQMDRHPGFLNGILSLALNTTYPESAYNAQSNAAVGYFHRAAASDLIERLKKEAPQSPLLPGLISQLLAAYAVYGEDDAIISRAPDFLTRYPTAPEAVDVALLLGDSYHHKNEKAAFNTTDAAAIAAYQKNEQAEFALYDRLLTDYAARSEHIPLGPVSDAGASQPEAEAVSRRFPPQSAQPPGSAPETGATERLDQLKGGQNIATVRSLAYERILDRYLSRLTESRRLPRALALYRLEIDHNPDDPGLYERLAAFVEQNKFDSEIEPLYRDAMNRFGDTEWASKLARYYLRTERRQDYQALVERLTGVFTGSELESFLQQVPPNARLNDQFAVSINEFAHQRFPHNLAFVRSLLRYYGNMRSTARSPVKYAALLRETWFYAPDLRGQFFATMVASGRLATELAALPKTEDAVKQGNLAALEFGAEGHAWLAHYEAAAPEFAALAQLSPGDAPESDRAISVHRSLADSVPGSFERAITLAEDGARRDASDHAAITRIGEIYADREQYAKAAPYWNQLAKTAPGSAEGYLESATVFWDYFQYDDALRLIHLGRTTLEDSARYAYEAGAIYENKNDLARAIDEYIQGVLSSGDDQSQRRLIKLGRRKTTHDLVETKTIAALAAGGTRAVDLRLALLENQGRGAEIAPLLEAEVNRAPSTERLATLRATAQRFRLAGVEEHALAQTVSLSTDPVEKLEARLEVASFREGRKDIPGAEGELSALLRENPNLLGVLRANVDFFGRTAQLAKAVPVLEAAAGRAVEPYRRDLLREASAKAADAGDFPEARKVLGALRAADPYNGDVLAAIASTYARQGDDQSLASFYQQTLEALNQASLPPQEKIGRIAALRRGYVAALVKLSRFPDALDQYIEILNRFPEDAALANEAAHFAETHNLADRLTSYYEKTIAASPKDYRWPLVLARVDRALRRYPEAIAWFEKASVVRPDRTDLLADKVDLETRLLRFEDALKTNQRLYELSYHDTRYLFAQAELHARLGHRQDAVKLLRQASLDSRQKSFENYALVARQLAAWSMFDDAKSVWEEGLPLIAGKEIGYASEFSDYLTLLTMLRQSNQALAKAAATDTTKEGNQAHTWAEAVGATIATYYTPEEKAQLAQAISADTLPPAVNTVRFLRAAGLKDLLADRLYSDLTARPLNSALRSELLTLESSQLRYAALGGQFEALRKLTAGRAQRVAYLAELVRIYRANGDDAAELRAYDDLNRLADVDRQAALIAPSPAQYGSHIADNDRGRLIAAYLIATTDEPRAFAALQAAGHPATKLWIPAYKALTGTFWSSSRPEVKDAFTLLMGPRTVGDQLSQKTAWDQHLTRDTWYYYAARYGEYLMSQKQDGADYLPAALEGSAAASNRYIELGEVYRDHGHSDQARLQFQTALQLSPERPEILDLLAQVDWEAGKKAQAIGEWKQSFDLLRAWVLNRKIQPAFWTTARNILIEANRNRIVSDIKPAADGLLGQYIRINGGYNLMPFITGILTDAPDRDVAVTWVIQITRDPKAASVLNEVLQSPLLTVADKDTIFREQLQRARQQEGRPNTGEETYPSSIAVAVNYAQYLNANHRYQEAWQLLNDVTGSGGSLLQPSDDFLLAATLSGHLNSLLVEYSRDPGKAPLDGLLRLVSRLQDEKHVKEANQVLEFVYSTQLAQELPPVTAYFGMAALRLDQKRNEEALALLRDVTLSQGAPFENLAQASSLLERAGLKAEAAAYAAEWHKAVPWNDEAALAAARLSDSRADLDRLRKRSEANYPARVEAAKALSAIHAAMAGTAELDLLTQEHIQPAQAELPYAADVRVAAAGQSTDAAAQVKLLMEAIAIRPELTAPRRDLAQAALRAKRDRLAVVAFESSSGAPSFVRRRFVPNETLNRSTLSDAERDLTEEVANAYRRLHDPQAPLELYSRVLASSPPDAQRKRVEQARETISAQMRLNAANQLRAPLLLPAIAQPRVVRPRLSTPPPLDLDTEQPDQEGGGQQ
jgi:cellulose synthase operon protein C